MPNSTLCHHMNCSTPGLSVPHYLPEFVEVQVHCISDATQSSHPLLPASSLAFNVSHHQGLFNESALCIRWPKYWSFSFSTSPSNEYLELISFRMDWFDVFVPSHEKEWSTYSETTWTNLEKIMLREESQTQKVTDCMNLFKWNIPNC